MSAACLDLHTFLAHGGWGGGGFRLLAGDNYAIRQSSRTAVAKSELLKEMVQIHSKELCTVPRVGVCLVAVWGPLVLES